MLKLKSKLLQLIINSPILNVAYLIVVLENLMGMSL